MVLIDLDEAVKIIREGMAKEISEFNKGYNCGLWYAINRIEEMEYMEVVENVDKQFEVLPSEKEIDDAAGV